MSLHPLECVLVDACGHFAVCVQTGRLEGLAEFALHRDGLENGAVDREGATLS